jgi:hypothetical protein
LNFSKSWPYFGSFGVGTEENSLPDVRRPEARSAGINRPDGVTLSFQVSVNKVEPSESVVTRNLFAKDKLRARLADEREPDGPEMTFIGCAGSFSGNRERLTRARSRPDAL